MREANAIVIDIKAPETLLRSMIEKGSVAVDGISLTVNRCEADRFQVSVIPHTARWTTIGFRSVGDAVHIETDLIGKYVEQFLRRPDPAGREPGAKGVGLDLLARTGFLK